MLALTAGCPAGIGSEIILKALDQASNPFSVVICGDALSLKTTQEQLHRLDKIKISRKIILCTSTEEVLTCIHNSNHLCLYQTKTRLSFTPRFGQPHPEGDCVQIEAVENAVELIHKGIADAIVTAPIHKSAFKAKGLKYNGHTEFLAHLDGKNREPLMMLMGGHFRVVPLTTHIPFNRVPSMLRVEKIIETIALLDAALKIDFAIKKPKIFVAGLNPHAGENGQLGDEEMILIRPAIETAAAQGIDVFGPFPPDTVYYRASRGEADVVLGMYHDQALIPLKLLHFEDGVNVTLNLGLVRTSVDHGTAYDIAGQGVANPKSLMEAMRGAMEIASNRRKHVKQDLSQ